MNQKSLIPISAVLVLAVMTLADVQSKSRLPNTREWLGYTIVFTLTSAAADIGIPVAGGFAMLILITVFLTRGGEALQFVNTNVAKPKGAKTKPKANQFAPQIIEAAEPKEAGGLV